MAALAMSGEVFDLLVLDEYLGDDISGTDLMRSVAGDETIVASFSNGYGGYPTIALNEAELVEITRLLPI